MYTFVYISLNLDKKMKKVENIKKIAVFDFDQTIAYTPLPEDGKIEYKNKTGKDWPHSGWWGRKESLDDEIFDIDVNKKVVDDYKENHDNDKILLVLLTGRIKKLSGDVEKILNKHNLHFDEYYYNDGGSTDKFKLSILDKLINKYENVEYVEMWDDRLEHIPKFEAWGKENIINGNIKDFNINVILS